MKTSFADIDWKSRAREFCKKSGTLEVANIEAAMREGASVAISFATERFSTLRKNIEAKNKP